MKKFLSLALALVMTMSLVTISAGAKDFTDNSKIAYKEAVDVMSSVKVIDGYTDGAFNPQNTLTRGAAAKIICNMILGPTTAGTLTADAAPFKDVPANHTFAGYIAYCAKQGIISGYADGSFRPAGTVTGYQFMKMLLGALGYDAATEGFTGANWSINVAKLASSLGLDKGNSEFVGTKAMTREEACLYAFNTLKATMVEYNSNASDITIGGVTISQGKGKATDVNNKADTETIKNDNLMQFAEKYFKDLKKTADGMDSFGRPATTWKNKTVKIGTYADKANASYTKDVELGNVYSDLGLTDTATATVYIDGVLQTAKLVVSKGNTAKIGTGNGVLTEAYLDDNTNAVTLAVVNTYVGEIKTVKAATSAKNAYVVVNNYTTIAGFKNEFETTAFAEDDVVLFTYSKKDNEIKDVVKATSVNGTLSAKVAGKSLTVGSTTYKYSMNKAFEATEAALSVDSEYTVYMDQYGYAIYVMEKSFVSGDYAFVLNAESASSTGFTSNRAKLVMADGTLKTVTTDKGYSLNGKIVTYKVNDKSEYVLRATTATNNNLTSGAYAATGTNTGATNFATKKNQAQITLTGTTYVYGNSNSVFVVKTLDSKDEAVYKAYTGIANLPSISASTGHDVDMYYYAKTTGVVTFAYIDASVKGTTITSSSKDVIFLAGQKSVSGLTSNKDNAGYYTYNAVVNGKITTLNVDASATGIAAGAKTNYLFTDVSYSSNNYVTALSVNARIISAPYGTVKVSGDYTIGFYNAAVTSGSPDPSVTRYTVANNAKIYTIDGDGKIAEAALKDIKTDANATAQFIYDDGQITSLFVQMNDAGTSTGPITPNAGDSLTLVGSTFTYKYTATNGAPSIITLRTAVMNYVAANMNYTWNAAYDRIQSVSATQYTATIDGIVYTINVSTI